MLWCWRCKSEMPMLDEEEYAQIAALHCKTLQTVKEFRRKTAAALNSSNVKARFESVCAKYEELTGFNESNVNAIMHHRIALYGPPCHICGKPLRTPTAKLCGNCMAPRSR